MCKRRKARGKSIRAFVASFVHSWQKKQQAPKVRSSYSCQLVSAKDAFVHSRQKEKCFRAFRVFRGKNNIASAGRRAAKIFAPSRLCERQKKHKHRRCDAVPISARRQAHSCIRGYKKLLSCFSCFSW